MANHPIEYWKRRARWLAIAVVVIAAFVAGATVGVEATEPLWHDD
jgi:hypothetical protein